MRDDVESELDVSQTMMVVPLRPGIYSKAALEEIGTATDKSQAILDEAERWRTIARATFRKARTDGFASGLEEGLETARDIIAQLQAARAAEAELQQQQARDMAISVVRRIIDDLNPVERVELALQRVQQTYEGAQCSALTVNPNDMDALRAAGPGSPISTLALVGDPAVSRGRALLKTDMGQIDLSLHRSLDAILTALDGALPLAADEGAT